MAGSKLTGEFCRKECGGACCRYICVKIDPPVRRVDRDEHRWLLMHEGVEIRIERRKWYLLVHTPCRNLRADNTCAVYMDRPDVCEDYDEDVCEGMAEPDERTVVFRTVAEYDAYLSRRGMPWRPRKRNV